MNRYARAALAVLLGIVAGGATLALAPTWVAVVVGSLVFALADLALVGNRFGRRFGR